MSRSPIAPFVSLVLAFASPASVSAQLFDSGEGGARELLPRAEEIALARSAAPAAVSGSASIYVLTADGYEMAVEGSGGAACYVSRDWLTSLEPHCFDPEGSATIMKIQMRRVELLHAGMSLDEAGATVKAELLRGEHRLPRRPAMSWMQSSAQQLVAPNGTPVGAWKPHVMIYFPFLTADDLALAGGGSPPASTMISDGGTPLSTLVVVVPDFVDP